MAKNKNSYNKINVKHKHGYVVSLPFHGIFMLKYRNYLCIIVKQYFPDTNVSFGFTVPRSLHRFFNVKDITQVDILSAIVYKFQCSSSNAIYISKTDQHFILQGMNTWVYLTELVLILLLDHILQ